MFGTPLKTWYASVPAAAKMTSPPVSRVAMTQEFVGMFAVTGGWG
jgi:hypothetical protein